MIFSAPRICAAIIQILFATPKNQMFCTVSLHIELLLAPISFLICIPTWLSEKVFMLNLEINFEASQEVIYNQ